MKTRAFVAGLVAATLLSGCLSRVDPRSYENFAARLELFEEVTALGSSAEGNARVVGFGDVVGVLDADYENFLRRQPDGSGYSVAVLRTGSRDVSRSTPVLFEERMYVTPRGAGDELVAGFALSGANLGAQIDSFLASEPVTRVGVGSIDEAGAVALSAAPDLLWVLSPEGVVLRRWEITDAEAYLAINRVNPSIVLGVKPDAITAWNTDTGEQRTIALERPSPLPVSRLSPFGAVLPYAPDEAFIAEGGPTIYTVSAPSVGALSITSRQDVALNARSLALNGDKTQLVVGNGLGGMILVDSTTPTALRYVNRATSTLLGNQVSYNPVDDSFAAAAIPIASVFKVFSP